MCTNIHLFDERYLYIYTCTRHPYTCSNVYYTHVQIFTHSRHYIFTYIHVQQTHTCVQTYTHSLTYLHVQKTHTYVQTHTHLRDGEYTDLYIYKRLILMRTRTLI